MSRDISYRDISRDITKFGGGLSRMEQLPMTEAMYYILLALTSPGYGYGVMQRIRELSGGRISMGPGTLYGVLTRMRNDGLIILTSKDDRRKNYAITVDGKKALATEYARLKAMVSDGKLIEEDMHE